MTFLTRRVSTLSGVVIGLLQRIFPMSLFPTLQCEQLVELLWKLKIPPKIRIFIWRVCLNAIPFLENLWKKKIVKVACCSRCESRVESVSHVIFGCRTVKKVWRETKFGSFIANMRFYSMKEIFIALAAQFPDDLGLICMIS
ncbi:hypothetical protein Ddye_021101 [Dipteronia dyeriana]|uniref:Reverse transcriptase zinc-binding domain-containing protein n=1 Tax=Dipteronia dyeriana TaxID=168575 RepID=A0AAD9U1U1_9ROSI|nr:hypothetical protein Ddye_021101 [Dipteronia dyeriana]